VVGAGVACVFTLLVQASAATISIAQVLARQGLVSLRTGIAIVLGANVGTVGTGLVAALGANRASQRIALCYLLVKVSPLPPFPSFSSLSSLSSLALQ
jgi:phosphate:Na+ symporter